MSILKKNLLKKRECTYKNNNRAGKLSMAPWNSKLLPQIGQVGNKIFCTKVHIAPKEKLNFQI